MLGLLALLLALQSPIDSAPKRFAYSEPHMGTEFRIILYAYTRESADRASDAAFQRIADLDALLSDYKTDSELSKLNRLAARGSTEWMTPSSTMWNVLRAGQRIAFQTDGAFDVTVGPCVRLWRRAVRQGQMPSEQRIQAARDATGWQHLELDPQTFRLRLAVPNMRLDLGGIAKGYALDEALRILTESGIQSALVDGGGDVATSAAPPGQRGWLVQLSEGSWNDERTVLLENEALATSGDRYQHVTLEGVTYSHIIDPSTGLGVTARRAATVKASSGMLADAWASALCVMDPEESKRLLAEHPEVDGIVFSAQEKSVETAVIKAASAIRVPPAVQPNIVFILADDLGWTDLGCMGSDYYSTPHIDALAEQGMRFSAAYTAAANCAPTRAALMSGQSSSRTGIYTVGSGARGKKENRSLVPPENKTELHGSVITLAESLRDAGYRTGHFGKWHLGGSQTTRPEAQGFEVNIAGTHLGHPPTYFWPYRKQKKNAEQEVEYSQQLPGLKEGQSGEYLTDRLTDEALKFLDVQDPRPFFLYLPHYAVHTPIQAPRKDVRQWKKARLGAKHQNPTYAAMVEKLDQSVGRIMAKLEELGVAENTLVVFYSDNGGFGGYQDAGVQMRDITHNGRLRGGKGMLYEGGIRVPLIMRLPGRIPARTVQSTPITTVDFYPTLLELAGAPLPPQELEGMSLVPLWQPSWDHDKAPSPVSVMKNRALYWHMPGYLEASKGWRTTPVGVIRSGRFKLMEFFDNGNLELYDLDSDLGERLNLADQLPHVRDRLLAQMRDWRSAIGAPMPHPQSTAN